METKPFWQSKAIIGGAVAALAGLLKICGVDISDLSPQLVDQILSLASLAGGILAIIGRLRARKPIEGTRAAASASGFVQVLVTLLLLPALLFSGCATATGDAGKDARGRATNEALSQAAKFLGSVAVSALLNAAQQEMGGSKVDFGSAASAGLWANVGTIASSGGVERIIDAYSGGKLPKTADVAAQVFASSSGSDAQVTNAIATVISTAAGAPPAVVR